jgi:hypothetical protein
VSGRNAFDRLGKLAGAIGGQNDAPVPRFDSVMPAGLSGEQFVYVERVTPDRRRGRAQGITFALRSRFVLIRLEG